MNFDLEQPAAVAGTATAAVATKPAGWVDLFNGRHGIYTFALAGGVTLHAVNMYIATTAMPSVIADIGGLDFYAWTTTLFVVASILGSALTAKLLNASGPRGAYVLATSIFALGTLTCALAPSMPVMLVGRAIQGLGGGFLFALAYALTRIVLPEHLWARAIGLTSAMFGVATLVGPAIGGIFAEYGAWRLAFSSLLPFCLAFAVVAYVTLPKKSWDTNERVAVPFLQLVMLTVAVLAVSAGSLSLQLTWNLAGLGAGLALIMLISGVDARASARVLPRGAFNMATPLGALYVTVALLMLAIQPEIFVPYLLQNLHGQSPLWSGYIAAVMSLGWSIASFMSSRWQAHADRLMVLGPLLVLAGLVLYALFMPVHGGGDGTLLLPICLGLLLIGFGVGVTWPSLVTRIFQSAPPAEQDLAAGGMTTVQLFFMALGTACAGMVANFAGIAEPGGAEGASNAAVWLGAIFAVAPALCVLVALRVVRLTGRRG
ncbi:MFS transporter [Aminobacter sp. MET-1]|uniref:MFS transporter n=1 Tax=Aminobacter sp. MET-1 TaxID=2951085 RepID=UPI00226A0244|nr:MFS transporter [Aminobacter sp. MET-1]MCX8570987.1 MFS transporter [Aminobacter sp. MET-1]